MPANTSQDYRATKLGGGGASRTEAREVGFRKIGRAVFPLGYVA
jgi:hypothetical protein